MTPVEVLGVIAIVVIFVGGTKVTINIGSNNHKGR